MDLPSTSFALKEIKNKYLELIASGEIESRALENAGLRKSTYIRLLLDDTDFAKAVEMARKHRAEHWVEKIADGVEKHWDKDEAPGAKLIFDKLAYLAKADNPDRYGSGGKGVNVNVNLGEFKLLPPDEAKRALANDPFAIEVEFESIPETGEDLL
jgi:hypothetical protein